MVLIQEIIRSLASLVDIVFTVLYWLLVIRIVLGWVWVNPSTTYNEVLGALYQVTDVILRPFQRIPLRVGLFDFSPIVAFVVLQLIQRLVVIGLYQLGGLFR